VARWSLACLLALAALAVPSHAEMATGSKARVKQGVKAEVKRGTLRITGNRRFNKVTLRLKRRKRGTLEVDVRSNGSADFSFKRKAFKRIVLSGGRGNDTLAISERNGSFVGSERTTLDGGRGTDRLAFTGSGAADSLTLSRSGKQLRLRRAAGRAAAAAANLPVAGRSLERLGVTPGGGADRVTLGNLRGAGVREAALQLGSKARGDGRADTVILNGTPANDSATAGVAGSRVTVAGLGPSVTATNLEPADRLTLNGLGGTDTLHVPGTPAADAMSVSAAGGLTHAVVGATAIDTDAVEALRLEPLGGADTLTFADLAGTDTDQVAADLGRSAGGAADGQADSVTVNGRDGADAVALSSGGSGVDIGGLAAGHTVRAADPADALTVNGGGGADTIDSSGVASNTAAALTLRGGPGSDKLTGGPSNETFVSDPGDGSDVVEGGAGTDTILFGGSAEADDIALSASGARAAITRDVDAGSVDMNDVEAARVVPAGGPDFVAVNDLAGTDLTQVEASLGASGGSGDGQADGVLVNGTAGDDVVNVTGAPAGPVVTGLPAQTRLTSAEPSDTLAVAALAGTDRVDASALPAGVVTLTAHGGTGNDTLIGSGGDDLYFGGIGDDRFEWGQGNDVFEGEAGTDRLVFNGSDAGESADISANGGRLRVIRNVGNLTMDCDDVETVDVNVFGGTDSVSVNNLAGTDVTQVNVALAATTGGGDGQADSVSLSATGGPDVVTLTGGPAGVDVAGVLPSLEVTGGELADRLTVNGLAGNDTIDASAVAAGAIPLTLNGDANDDTVTGGAGDDTLTGGPGADVLTGGLGIDILNAGGDLGDVEIP
jgi:RTX calcium-binding nonapeptide repeat (4 copies)